MICTCEDYDILAGSKEFVTKIVGDIYLARKKFFDFANQPTPLENLRQLWLSVSKKYEKFNSE